MELVVCSASLDPHESAQGSSRLLIRPELALGLVGDEHDRLAVGDGPADVRPR